MKLLLLLTTTILYYYTDILAWHVIEVFGVFQIAYSCEYTSLIVWCSDLDRVVLPQIMHCRFALARSEDS